MDVFDTLPILIRVILLVFAVLILWLLGVLVPRMIRSAFPRSGDEDQAGDDSNRTSSPTI